MMYQPILVEVLMELSIHVFTAIIKVKDSEFRRKLGLNHCVKRVEGNKKTHLCFSVGRATSFKCNYQQREQTSDNPIE